jgi:hypothetical protein
VARALENEVPEDLPDAESVLRTAEEIADHGLVPIITAAELAWESNAPYTGAQPDARRRACVRASVAG